jgi:hypothetical protein
MERWIDRGPTEGNESEPGNTSAGTSMSPPPSVKMEDANVDEQRETAKYADRRSREGRLCILQGLLLFAFYGLYSEDKEKHLKGRALLARCVEVREYFYSIVFGHRVSLGG